MSMKKGIISSRLRSICDMETGMSQRKEQRE